jgi:sugar lactone lactonase YvrE
LNRPRGVIVDNNGYMYIADESNNRIQRWAPGGCVGECLVGCSQLNGSASDRLGNPQAMAFDSKVALYVSDGYQNRVQKFAIQTATVTIGTNHDRIQGSCQIRYCFFCDCLQNH